MSATSQLSLAMPNMAARHVHMNGCTMTRYVGPIELMPDEDTSLSDIHDVAKLCFVAVTRCIVRCLCVIWWFDMTFVLLFSFKSSFVVLGQRVGAVPFYYGSSATC